MSAQKPTILKVTTETIPQEQIGEIMANPARDEVDGRGILVRIVQCGTCGYIGYINSDGNHIAFQCPNCSGILQFA